MITSYVHALILPMFRVIGSCIMTYIIHFLLLLPVYSMVFFFTSFVIYLFLLILLYLSYFLVCSKIQKPIKIEKAPKSLIACFVYITCELP